MLKKLWLISFFILLGFIICAQEKKEDKLERQFNDAIYALADKKENVRQAAAETLGMLGDRRAVPYLIKSLADKKENVRQAAAETLGMLRDRRAVPYLIKSLMNGQHYAGMPALEALCRIDENWIQLPEVQAAVSHFINSLSDKDRMVREVAAKALGKIGDKRAVPHLINALGYVPSAAVTALHRIDENWVQLPEAQAAVSHFINSLHDNDNMVRQAAIEALGKIGDKQVVPHLIKSLTDKNLSVRMAAAEALGRLGDNQAVPALVKSLSDDYIVRIAAAEALGRLGDKQAISELIIKSLSLWDENLFFFITATEALLKIDPNYAHLSEARHAVPEIINILIDKNKCFRWLAARRLGDIGDQRAVPHLIKCLADEDEDIRKAAREALKKMERKSKNQKIESNQKKQGQTSH